ncbi:uncharacterized protein METZ01_LOCUS457669, partial [marine metagenome]
VLFVTQSPKFLDEKQHEGQDPGIVNQTHRPQWNFWDEIKRANDIYCTNDNP